jgi:hypothetical protein
MDRSEDVLDAQKAGKTPSGPLGLNCSIETSNSSSFWRAHHRVAQTCDSLHVCDRTDTWVTVLRPRREGKHNSQTSQRSCERIGGGEHLDFREGFTLLRRAVIARDNYGGRIESPSWFPPEP